MSRIRVYQDTPPHQMQIKSDLLLEVTELLRDVEVDFQHMPKPVRLEQLLLDSQLQTDLKREIVPLEKQHQFPFSSVALLNEQYPNFQRLRLKYLSEHSVDNDEIYYVLQGELMLYLHVGNQVFSVLCQKGDCLLIPGKMQRWFDVGQVCDEELALMICTQQKQEQVLIYTGNNIADLYPRLA